MAEPVTHSRRPIAALALLAVPALLLSACGPSRDEVLAEKVARAENAAEKAEQAQQAAERAARAAGARLNEVNAAREEEGAQPTAVVGDRTGEEPIDTANAATSHNTDLSGPLAGGPVR